MRLAAVLTLWGMAAGIAGAQFAAPPARSLTSAGQREILARFVGPETRADKGVCAMTLAVPQELHGLAAAASERWKIVSLVSPLGAFDISTQAMAQIWQTTTLNPKLRLGRIARNARTMRETMAEGLEAVTGSEGRAMRVEAGQAREMQQKLTGR